MTDYSPLDNPIWAALTSLHEPMAVSNGLARRYAGDVSPLVGLREPTAGAFANLAALVGSEEGVALFTPEPVDVPGEWQVLRAMPLEQMVGTESIEPTTVPLSALGPADVPEMMALTAATEPGPFRPETIKMGRYYGIRSSEGRLVAMAGERLRLNRFTEISAVCTDPEFRGRGYGRALVAFLTAQGLREGKTPFLHVRPDNGAKALYEKLGFRLRRTVGLTVISLLPATRRDVE